MSRVAEHAPVTVPQIQRTALERLFAPESIAVIGASEKSGSVGRAVVENLSSFAGNVTLVNPNHACVLGRATVSRVTDVHRPIDLAVIAVPAPAVPQAIRDCVAAHVGAAVILSAGFKETGERGVQLEQEVSAIARHGGLRLLGPNCLGLIVPRLLLNASFATSMPAAGHVAFLSQSGALCTAILDWSEQERVGFSAFVSVGSMLDVCWGDLINYFGDEPHTRSIVCYVESIGDARSFLSAAREVALTKPIIVLKVGRTTAGARAAVSHTGALTGSDSVIDAAFRRVGVLRVNDVEELFDMAEVLAKQPRVHGSRLAIVTNAGGPGALASDAIIATGGRLAELAPNTTAQLNVLLPPHWSHGNPIDVLGDASAKRIGAAVELALKDPGVDGVLTVLTPQSMTDAVGTARELERCAEVVPKPLLASFMGGAAVREGEAILNAAGIPTFKYPDRAARAFALMCHYSANLHALYETPALCGLDCPVNAAEAVAEVIQAARQGRRTLLTEVEAKQVLRSYGIPVVETRCASSEQAAIAAADSMGYPVVLKLWSHAVTHKALAGGVRLNLCDAAAVRDAWRRIHRTFVEKDFLGVTVQRMVSHSGVELIIGSKVDEQFGPVLLFGTGGSFVEALNDTAIGLPPLNATLAHQVVNQTRVSKVLERIGATDAVVSLLVRFSQLVAEQPHIAELDINPLVVSGNSLVALDARVVLRDSNAERPKLAIRPYPTHYVHVVQLKHGEAVTVRPIRPEDEPALREFHHALSERSVYYRYFAPLKLDERIDHERLSRLCFIDYDREMALVAEHQAGGGAEIVGVGRLSRCQDHGGVEFALIVADAWQGRGLGTELLRSLVEVARAEGRTRVAGIILKENLAMQNVAAKLGFKLKPEPHENIVSAELEL